MNLPPQCCKITALLTASTLSKAEMKPKFKYERDWERERKKQKIKWCQFWCFIWLSITAPHLITIFFFWLVFTFSHALGSLKTFNKSPLNFWTSNKNSAFEISSNEQIKKSKTKWKWKKNISFLWLLFFC